VRPASVDNASATATSSAAEELNFSIGIHEGGNSGMPTVGIDRFEGRGAQHIISHTMEMMLACMSMIWGGVCERHPKLRVAFLESGGGWIAPWLDRMDRHFDDQGFNDSGLKTRPSDLFRRNCWISFEPVEGSLKVLAEYIGPKKILWATDYPHRDGFFPGAPKMILDRLEGASPETRHGVMAGGTRLVISSGHDAPCLSLLRGGRADECSAVVPIDLRRSSTKLRCERGRSRRGARASDEGWIVRLLGCCRVAARSASALRNDRRIFVAEMRVFVRV